MKLTNVRIRNFRGLADVAITFDKCANVIVGPNAVGKTSVLEAIRLAKSLLAPRINEEAQQVLIALGALSPHNPTRLNFGALCGNPQLPVIIRTEYELDAPELDLLESLAPTIALDIVRASLGMNPAAAQLNIIQYLSTQEGNQALQQATNHVNAELPKIRVAKILVLELTLNPKTQNITGSNQAHQLVFAALENQLPPHQTRFSYFPADRALPTGEVNIQIGGPDVAAQLQAHSTLPQNKYQRLKTTILNSALFKQRSIEQEFKEIFTHVLKDREFAGVSINEYGLVSIQIRQTADGRVFDIDAMSSGEKGLILTLLLVSQNVADGGIVLIDEPELHLNPAVCKLLLPFLIERYLSQRNIQVLICSHSPELLAVAFDRRDCSLQHLQSSTAMSRIYPDDKNEVFDALKRLGTSPSDVMFSRGSIYVEGEHDADILQEGFSKLVGRYHITDLGGRTAVEKEIGALQAAESRGEIDTLKCFIFDLDEKKTDLKSSNLVRVLQWKRRCLENFLIDEKIIYDILAREEVSAKKIGSRGEVRGLFKDLAFSQIPRLVIQEVYARFNFENPGLRSSEIAGKTIEEAGETLFGRLAKINVQLKDLDREAWCAEFVKLCTDRKQELEATWDAEWLQRCDGKRFFRDLHAKFSIRISQLRFKKMVIERMEAEKSDGWVLVEKQISDALKQ